MRFVHPEIQCVIDTDYEKIFSLVIENQKLFRRLIEDIQNQIEGCEGCSVLSENNKPLEFSKSCCLITQFIPFDVNQKNLLTKVVNQLEKEAISGENYEKTMMLLSEIESHLMDLSLALEGGFNFSNLNIRSIIKSAGVEFVNDYTTLSEKIIDYIELVRAYDREKLFVLVNLRSYMDDDEVIEFIDTSLRRGYHIIMIENSEHNLLKNEKRIIIDEDLCEIS